MIEFYSKYKFIGYNNIKHVMERKKFILIRVKIYIKCKINLYENYVFYTCIVIQEIIFN